MGAPSTPWWAEATSSRSPRASDNFLTNIPVSAGDVLGFRASTVGTGCRFPTGEALRFDVTTPGDPEQGETRDLSSPSFGRVNVSATLDPTDPTPSPGPTNIDSSATRGKQSADKLKIKVTADQDSTLDIGGKAKVAQRTLGPNTAKSKTFKLKPKTGIALQGGLETTVRVKFKKNRKTVKQIAKLQKGSNKARKRSKVIGNLTTTTAAGLVAKDKVKIKLK